MKKLTGLIALLTVFTFFSCNKDISYEEQLAKDIEVIQNYLEENGLTAQSTASGLHYIIEEPGSAEHPSATSDVTVSYKGYFTNGQVFDQSQPGKPITFNLQQVIPGWTEGIQLFGRGGKGTLLIPSGLGYGKRGSIGGAIPGNTVILFDVELINF